MYPQFRRISSERSDRFSGVGLIAWAICPEIREGHELAIGPWGWMEWYEVKEIASGMALATGIVAQCFPMRNRRLAPCHSLREGPISHHSGLDGQTRTVFRRHFVLSN